MNTGSGTVLLNPTKATSNEPNETAERIAKPVNKTDDNKLNLNHFKPFTGQGQTLGGGKVQPDRSKSRLLASNIGNNINSNVRDSSNGNPAHNNKKVCLGNRSVYSSQPSTSHSNSHSSPSNNNRPNSGSSNNMRPNAQHRTGHSSSGNNTNRIWNLGDEELEDDYEYKKLHTSFTKDNLDNSFEEMENMMNDTDVDVFENISDETLSGSQETSEHPGNTGTKDHRSGIKDESNASLDDIFEISSDEDPDDETHCPVCNKVIARSAMNEHLENCMELSQVFENVAIDEDDEEEMEKDMNDGKDSNDTGDGGSSVPNGLVKCPICNADILEPMANEHIDECLAKNISQELD